MCALDDCKVKSFRNHFVVLLLLKIATHFIQIKGHFRHQDLKNVKSTFTHFEFKKGQKFKSRRSMFM